MLYHLNYYDGIPLTGIGLYGTTKDTAERVSFNIVREGYLKWLKLNQIETEAPNLSISDDIIKSILKLSTDDISSEIDLGDYTVEYSDDEVFIYQKRKYDIYRLPPDIISMIDSNHKLFQEMVGYHTDHDPSVYKPFTGPSRWEDYYTNVDRNVFNIDLSDKSTVHLDIIREDNIIWIHRPSYDKV